MRNVAPAEVRQTAHPGSALHDARLGDAAAFATLVRSHQATVFSIGYRMLGRRDAAEDLAQDVFLQLYRRLDDIESPEHLGFWLRRVASNLAIDRLRRAPARLDQPLDDGMEIAAPAADADPLLSRELARLLAGLSPAARAVMVLRYQEDCDVAVIAATLDMPLNTVKSHLKRSLAALRVGLTEELS